MSGNFYGGQFFGGGFFGAILLDTHDGFDGNKKRHKKSIEAREELRQQIEYSIDGFPPELVQELEQTASPQVEDSIYIPLSKRIDFNAVSIEVLQKVSDFYKADRAGGLHARRIAKQIVRLGLATEATVVLGWFPGNRSAQIFRITDQLGQQVKLKNMDALFDTSLLTSGEKFGSDKLIELARWGHFFHENRLWEVHHHI